VLEGIEYLRGLGRALATLGPETILLTQSGDVKISEVSADMVEIDKTNIQQWASRIAAKLKNRK
jgi:hypothetical protein